MEWDRSLPWLPRDRVFERGLRVLAFSPDGKLLAAGGHEEGTVQLWDLSHEPYRIRATIKGLASTAKNLLFLPDGKSLLTLDQNGTLRAWTGLEGQPTEAPVPVKLTGVTAMACAANGQALALGDKTGHLHYYGLEGGQWVEKADRWLSPQKEVNGVVYAPGPVYAIAFAPDGRSIAVASSGRTVGVWSTAAMPPRLLTQLEAGTGNDHGLFFSRDGRQLVCLSNTPIVWQRDGDRFKSRFPEPKSFRANAHAALTTDGETLVLDGAVFVEPLAAWDIRGSRPVKRAELFHNCYAIQAVRFAPDGRSLFVTESGSRFDILSGFQSNYFTRWDLTQSKGRKGYYKKAARYFGGIVSPDCRSVVACDGEGVVLMAIDGDHLRDDPATGASIKTLITPLRFRDPVFSPDSRFLATWYAFRDLTPSKKTEYFGDGKVVALAFAPDSKTLATRTPEGTVQLWECGEGAPRLLRSWKGDPPDYSRAAFGPNGQSLVLAGEDFVVRSWDLTQNPPHSTAFVKKHTDAIYAVAFAPGETKLATAGADGWVVVWTPQGEVLKEWQLSGPVYDVSFASDGRHLATANAEGTVFVLRLP
jgi:WD40 repeat protein